MGETDRAQGRLGDKQVREALTRLDELLGEVEQTPGPAGEIAMEAVSALARVYGEALARALSYVADTPALFDGFLRDELLGHLLVLHDIHPEPVAVRVARAIDELSGAVRDRGGEIELAEIDGGVATVRLATHGCGSSSAGIADVVRESVLAIAPELSDVAVVRAPRHETAFVPLDVLTARPPAAGAHR
jgi:Fe-S cluster biogenesis protein NfuA